MTTYYLDTTALIELWAGDGDTRAEIASLLERGDGHVTSSHVRREWKRIVDSTAADVLNAIADGVSDFTDLYARLGQGWGRDSGQRFRVLAILANQEESVDLITLKLRAEQLLRYRSKVMFDHHLDDVRDGSECGLARNEVKRGPDGRYRLVDTCKRTDEICRQRDFIEERRALWRTASEGLLKHASRDGDRKMGRIGLEVLNEEDRRKGKNCYARTGDISISVECRPGEETLLTTDRSFEAIGKEVGAAVQTVAATPGP